MGGFLAAVVLELMRESLTGTHCRYRLPDGDYVTLACDAPVPAFDGSARSRLRRVVKDNVAYDYDGTTLVRTIPLWYNAKPARVFDPNPIVATNDPSLRDRNDAANAVPPSAYTQVEVPDASPFVKIVDLQSPFIAPSEPGVYDREQDGFEDTSALFHIDRTQRYLQSLGYIGSKQIAGYAIETDTHASGGADNSFFQPSNTQAGRGTLFFGTGGTDDAEDADLVVHEYAHAIHEWIAPGTFLGTFASQSRAIGEGFGDYWAFSNHHAQRLASGRDPFCFADWDARCDGDDASEQCGYPPGADCLRRLDTGRTMRDYDFGDSSGTEHRNGAIWSGALISLFEGAGKRVSDILVIESLFGAPSNPTFATMAQRMVNADRQLYAGAHIGAICGAMASHGIVTGADCGYTPRGELTLFQSGDRALPIPENNTDGVSSSIVVNDTRAIERLFVRVDITHPSRGDLRLTLTAPDGTRVILQQVSFDRAADVHVTFGLDAASFESLDAFNGHRANGTWTLNVADMRALDAGTLDAWGLQIQFAGEVPRSERPAVSSSAKIIPVVVDGTFRTDVFLFSDTDRTATLIFTPSEADGRTTFSAARVNVPARQVVALRDVLPTLFATSGSGDLVVDGDVLVSARIRTAFEGGTVGHVIDAVTPSTNAIRFDVLPPIGRINVGIAEGAGVALAIDVRVDGVVRRVVVPPYSHVQFAVPAGTKLIEIPPSTPFVAYVSIVDNTSNDALYLSSGVVGAAVTPAIRAPGANGTMWRTSALGSGAIAFIDPAGGQATTLMSGYQDDVFASLFLLTNALGVFRVTPSMRVVLRARDATTSLVPPSNIGVLFPIERSARFRSNLTLTADDVTVVHITVYDAAGQVLETFDRTLARNRLDQVPLMRPVVDGRVVVEGEGVHAWVSVIDNATGDATILGAH